MYLPIGNDMAVRARSIIGIFDLDNTTVSKRTQEFLNQAEKNGEVVPCDDFGVCGYVRIAYCVDKARVLGALPAFEKLAREYQSK